MKSNLATVDHLGVLHVERVLSAPIDRVWAFLVEPEKRAAWLAGGTMADKPGGRIELRFDHVQLSGERAPADANACHETHLAVSHLLRIEPPHLLAMSWDEGGPAESEVTFELSAESARSTLLRITHKRLPDRAQLLSHASGWHTHLDALDDKLGERPPRSFWTNFAAHKAVYDNALPA